MRAVCDWCGRSVKKAGRLMKVKFLMLCRACRKKFKRSHK